MSSSRAGSTLSQGHSIQDPDQYRRTRAKRGVLNLLKCNQCRRRKVRCEPKDRTWPERCDHCRRRGEDCSPPQHARGQVRYPPSPAQSAGVFKSIVEQATLSWQRLQDGRLVRVDAQGNGAHAIELSYRELTDTVLFLGLHGQECEAQYSQAFWLSNGRFDWSDPHETPLSRHPYASAIEDISSLVRECLQSLLRSTGLPEAERALLCRLLADIMLSQSMANFSEQRAKISLRRNFRDEHILAHPFDQSFDLLRSAGDDSGALALSHQMMYRQLFDLGDVGFFEELVDLGTAICDRVSAVVSKLGWSPKNVSERGLLTDQDPILLPYSVSSDLLVGEGATGSDFIKISFTWPWVRRRIVQSWTDEAQVESWPRLLASKTSLTTWLPLEELLGDLSRFTDACGYSAFHAAVFSGEEECVEQFVGGLGGASPRLKADLLNAEPFYASFTPVSLAVQLGQRGVLDALLSVPETRICSHAGAVYGHDVMDCPLALAMKVDNVSYLESLVKRSRERDFDYRPCLRQAITELYPSLEYRKYYGIGILPSDVEQYLLQILDLEEED